MNTKQTMLTFRLAFSQMKREVNVNVKAKEICNKSICEFIISTNQIIINTKFSKN